jgi:hypothetical protein
MMSLPFTAVLSRRKYVEFSTNKVCHEECDISLVIIIPLCCNYYLAVVPFETARWLSQVSDEAIATTAVDITSKYIVDSLCCIMFRR